MERGETQCSKVIMNTLALAKKPAMRCETDAMSKGMSMRNAAADSYTSRICFVSICAANGAAKNVNHRAQALTLEGI